MSPDVGPFTVQPSQVARLGIAFTPFVNRLLDIETASAGLAGAQLATTYKENSHDGGVDAAVTRSVGTTWLPEGDSVWQYKSGDCPPNKCKTELENASFAKERIKAGAKYILVVGAELNADQIADRKAALVEKATELELPHEEDLFEVRDATMLARWASMYPALAVSQLIGGPGAVAKDHEAWASSIRHQTQWVDADSRKPTVESLGELLKGSTITDIRVSGVSGLGKSRLVLEALRDPSLSPLVAYIPEESSLNSEYVNHIVGSGHSVVLVVDDCSERRHEKLAEQMRQGEPIRLITIGEPDADPYPIRGAALDLSPLENAGIEAILRANFEVLWPEARRFIVDQCAGNPRFAIILAERLRDAERTDAASLIDAKDIGRFLGTVLPAGTNFLASTLLALFERIGWDRDRRFQMEAVARFGHVEPSELEGVAAALEREDLFVRHGRYRSITPHPLATYLAAEGWRHYGPRIATELLPTLDSEMSLALFKRVADLGRFEPAQAVLRDLLSAEGPFGSLEKIEDGGQGGHLTQLAIVLPDETTRLLSRVISQASVDALRQAVVSRRDLVWTLEKLAWHRQTFSQAADCLLQLSLAENETYANNATGTWIQLFGALLPGTAATPEQRQSYLSRVVVSPDIQIRKLAVDACAQGLSPMHESIAVSGELQAGSLVEARGTPTTWGEVADYRKASIANLLALSTDSEKEVADAASSALIKSIHPLFGDELVADALLDALLLLPEDRIPAIREAVVDILSLYSRTGIEEDRRLLVERLHRLNDALPALGPIDELHQLVSKPGWEDRGEVLAGQVVEHIRTMKDGDAVRDAAYEWLASEEIGGAWELGYALFASGVYDDGTITRLIDAFEKNSPALAGFLTAEVDGGNPTAFDDFLDGPLGEGFNELSLLLLTVRGPATPRASERIRSLVSRLPVTPGTRAIFGWQRNLSEEDLVWLLEQWVSRIASEADYMSVLDWFGIASYRREQWPEALERTVFELVMLRRQFPDVGQERWQWARLAERFLPTRALEIAKLVLDNIEAGLIIINADEEAQLLVQAARIEPSDVWSDVGERLTTQWRIQMGVRGWLTSAVPVETIQDWIGDSVERARLVAAIAGVTASAPTTLPRFAETYDSDISPVARVLLTKFGEDDEVRSSLYGDFTSGAWSGPQSNVLAQQIGQLKRWSADPNQTVGVKRWADEVVGYLERRRTEVLEWESEQRF